MGREKIHSQLRRAAGECTCFNLRKVTRAVTQVFDDHLQVCGLRGTQFTLLVSLELLGSVTVSDLAERLMMDRTTLTRNLKPLEAKKWVQIAPGKDRRTRELKLTAAGRRLLQRAAPYWERAQNEVINHLGKARWESLMGELEFAQTRFPNL